MSRRMKRMTLEQLEARQLLSTVGSIPMYPQPIMVTPPIEFKPLDTGPPVLITPPIIGTPISGVNTTFLSTPPFSPAKIRAAYGIPSINLNGVAGDGIGQTVCIVDAGGNPTIAADLAAFNTTFGLPQMDGVGGDPTFTQVNQTGGSTLPVSQGWELEEALDVEWVHSIAPKANIVLVEANDAFSNNMIDTAVPTAAGLGSVVSMSFGINGNLGVLGEDPIFTHPNVTYLASTGDNGAPGGDPAYSPNVVAVGGTSLTINNDGSYASESGWSGSGGGVSNVEAVPSYQTGLGYSGRSIPDVSFDADPATGVYVYSGGSWWNVGGTSLSAPCWAGLIAIADQGRVLAGLPNLTGNTDVLPKLYNIYHNGTQYSADFHDMTTGNNGNAAGVGYDLVTGIGTPKADTLVYDLSGLTHTQQHAVINVTPYTVPYDAQPHSATGTATGVGGLDLSADLTILSTHTNAGTYPDSWSFHDPLGVYADDSGTMTDTISMVAAAINVTPYNVVYDGNPHTVTGTATGVGGVNLAADLDLTHTTHTAVGTYNGDPWRFHDPNGNYTDAVGTVNDVIQPATQQHATINLTPYTVPYDAQPHSATGTATGVGGLDLSADLTILSTHTNASVYSDSWTFHDPLGVYADDHGTMTDTINQVAATINVTPYNVTYDALPHTATGTTTGVSGVDLSAYLNLGGTTHTNASSYLDSWTFHDPNGNYSDANASITDTITQATAAINVIPYNVVYDGNAYTATGIATGIGGVDLSSGLDLSKTTHTAIGDYRSDAWSFNGGTNYVSTSGTVYDIITANPQLTAIIKITPYNVIYDAKAHSANGTAKGVNNLNLNADLHIVSTHTNAGVYIDTWTFHDPTNVYKDLSGSFTDRISKANAKISVTPYNVVYDGNAHRATGTAKGVGGASITGLDLSGTTHTDRGVYRDTWTFSNPNYNLLSGTITDSIKPIVLVTAEESSRTTIKVTFNGALDPTSAQTVANYLLTTANGKQTITFSSAVYNSRKYTVILTARSKLPNGCLKLSGNVLDFSGTNVSFSSNV